MAGILKHVLDGKQLDHEGLLDTDLVADAFLDVKAGVIQIFTGRGAFLKAVKDAELQGDFRDAFRKLDEHRTREGAMSNQQKTALEVQQVAQLAAKRRAVDGIFRMNGIDPKKQDPKALLKLHKAGEFGSMLVYDSAGCVGDWAYFAPGWYQKLSPFGWNDRISSFYNLGLLASLHRHTWFRGATLWVPTFARYKEMGWWSNRISSMIFYD